MDKNIILIISFLSFTLVTLFFITKLIIDIFNLRTIRIKYFVYKIRKNIKLNLFSNNLFKKFKIPKYYKIILLWFIFSRVFILFFGILGELFYNELNGISFETFRNLWNRWDSPHYISIAENGYLTTGDERFFIVFYPLYPLLLKMVNLIINDFFWSGILISNICLLVSSIFLYKLIKLDFNEKIALNSVLYLMILPFTFFLSLIYTECLFLLISILCFYFIRINKWWLSGICCFLATLTKNQGILLTIPIIIEAIFYIKSRRKLLDKKELTKLFILKVSNVIWAVCGFFCYLLLNKLVTGDWLKFLEYQHTHWSNRFGLFYSNLANIYENIFNFSKVQSVAIFIPELILFFIVIFLIYYGVKNKVRHSYTAYALGYLLISYSPTWLLSSPRYIMSLFIVPLYLSILRDKLKHSKYILDWSMISLLLLYTVLYSRGLYVM